MNEFKEMPGLSPDENFLARTYHENETRQNALKGQYDVIREMIDTASEWEELENVASLLRFAAPVWETLSYKFAILTMRRLIRQRAERMLRSERQYLEGLRKNDRTRRMTETAVIHLTALVAQHTEPEAPVS